MAWPFSRRSLHWLFVWLWSKILEDRSAFLLFYLATGVSACYGGLGPGLLATFVGGLLGDYYFVEPHHTLLPQTLAAGVQLGLYLLVGVLVSGLAFVSAARQTTGGDSPAHPGGR